MIDDSSGGEEALEGAVGVTGIDGGLHVVNEARRQAIDVQGWFVEHE
jgi:hypothetical protein